MDEMSETESQGRDSKIDNDGTAIPAIISNEYLEEILEKCSTVSLIKQMNLFNIRCIFLVFIL